MIRPFLLPARALRRATLLLLALTALPVGMRAQGPAIPAPAGMVNDFARVLTPEQAERLGRIVEDVRAKSGGEIAIVTLPDLAGREVGEVALRIGREWGVGAKAEVGDRARNAGVVILLVPKESSGDGRGHISIQSGQGAEGFITDAMAGDLRRAATAFFRRQDYGSGLLVIADGVADRYAAEFGFTRDANTVVRRRRATSPPGIKAIAPLLFVAMLVVLIAVGGRRRRGSGADLATAIVLDALLNSGRRGGWGGGGFGGGGGGGGFGGFGGGGGFSGGGSSGSW